MILVFLAQFLLYGGASALGYFLGVRKNITGKIDTKGSFIIGIVGGGVIAGSNIATEYLKLHSTKDSAIPIAAPFGFFLVAIILLYVLAGYRAKKLGADVIVAKKVSEKTMSAPILLMMIFVILSLLGIVAF